MVSEADRKECESLTNEQLAVCIDEEVDFLVRFKPHETAHIAVFTEIARRLRANG